MKNFISSKTGQKSNSNGSQWTLRSLREAKTDPGFGQREEKNENNQIFVKSSLGRDDHFVSIKSRFSPLN